MKVEKPQMTETEMTFWIRDDRYGDPIVHLPECTCPSIVSQDGKTIHPSVWISDGVENIAELAIGLSIEPSEIRIAHCIPNSLSIANGWGRRYRKGKPPANTGISPELGDWVRSIDEMTKLREIEKESPVTGPRSGNLSRLSQSKLKNPANKTLPSKLQFAQTNPTAGRPASAHADCEHPRTKAARAKCRRSRNGVSE